MDFLIILGAIALSVIWVLASIVTALLDFECSKTETEEPSEEYPEDDFT